MTTSLPSAWDHEQHFNITSSTIEPYKRPFSDADVIVVTSILLALFVVGVFGNIVTMVVIITNKNLRSVFHIFLISLCVSDLYSALISPLALHRRTWGFDDWIIPSFFCKFYWGSDLWTSYATAGHVFSFALLRLLSVRWPHHFSRISKRWIMVWIIGIWVVTLIGGFVPFAILIDAEPRNRFDANPSSKWPSCTCVKELTSYCKYYTTSAYSIFLYLPCVGVIVISIIVGCMLRRRGKDLSYKLNQRDTSTVKENQAILQLVLIVGSFLLGYLPFTSYAFYTQLRSSSGNAGLRFDWAYGTAYYICLRISECLNPLFYNLGSSKIREATWKLFLHCFKARDRSLVSQHQPVTLSGKISQEIRVRASFDDPVLHDERVL